MVSGSLGRAAGALALVLLMSCGSSTSPYGGGGGCTPTATKVCMSGSQFSPSTLTVPAGTTVTWQNGDAVAHTVTSATGSADVYTSGNLGGGATYTHQFATAGTYPYYCMNHGANGTPPTGMHGTITVTP